MLDLLMVIRLRKYTPPARSVRYAQDADTPAPGILATVSFHGAYRRDRRISVILDDLADYFYVNHNNIIIENK